MIEVDITSAGKHYMMGRVVKEAEVKRPDTVPPPLPKGTVSGIQEVGTLLYLIYFSVLGID